MTTRKTYIVHAQATPDAVARAMARARLEGHEVVTVDRVSLAEGGWAVTLVVVERR